MARFKSACKHKSMSVWDYTHMLLNFLPVQFLVLRPNSLKWAPNASGCPKKQGSMYEQGKTYLSVVGWI